MRMNEKELATFMEIGEKAEQKAKINEIIKETVVNHNQNLDHDLKEIRFEDVEYRFFLREAYNEDIIHIKDEKVLKEQVVEEAKIIISTLKEYKPTTKPYTEIEKKQMEFEQKLSQQRREEKKRKQHISLIKRLEDVFSKLRKPKLSNDLEALQEMTVLMIDAYEYLQLLNNQDVSKNDPEFLKEVEDSVARVNADLKAHREDVLDYERN